MSKPKMDWSWKILTQSNKYRYFNDLAFLDPQIQTVQKFLALFLYGTTLIYS